MIFYLRFNPMLIRLRRYDLVDLAPADLRDQVLTKCNLCSYEGKFVLLAAHQDGEDPLENLVGRHAQIATVACPQCGWTFKPGRLTHLQIKTLYDRQGNSGTLNPTTFTALEQRSKDVKRYIESVVGKPITGARILDVGGGAGQVSIAFARASCRIDLLEAGASTPIDSSMTAIRASFDEFKPTTRYDVVIMSHVLEHTWTPSEWLQRARDLLTNDGVLFIEVPFEYYTPYIKAKLGDPCHVGYFCKHTLSSFLSKSGFETLSVIRALTTYESRHIMALRAVGKRGHAPSDWEERVKQRAILSCAAEMIHPHQLLIASMRR